MDLTSEQNELILDYFFRCAELEQSTQGSALLDSNLEAAKLYNALKRALSHLDHLKIDECPCKLVDMTLARLKLTSNRCFPAKTQWKIQNRGEGFTGQGKSFCIDPPSRV